MAAYPDLKSYLHAKHKEILEEAVQKYVDGHLDGSGFHDLNVLSLTSYELDNFEIKSVRCKDELGDLINIDIIISVDVIELGLGSKKYEADRNNHWFIVTVRGDLSNKFNDLCVLNTTEYFDKKFVKESALDQFLVPYIYSADLEEHADTFTLFYVEDAIYDGYMLPVYDILRMLKLDFYYADLPDKMPRLVLSDYAREHAEECCLIFSWKSTSYWKDECEFYGQAYLSKEVTAEPYVEYTYDKDFNSKSKQSESEIREAVAAYQAALKKDNEVKIEMMKQGCNDFASTLVFHMDRKNITIEQLVERSELSDTTIKNYRSGKVGNPPIENVMAICIGLNLKKKYAEHLLSTASYSLGDSKRDNAYRFLLDYTDGTLLQWNTILDAFNVSHIPYKRGQKTN